MTSKNIKRIFDEVTAIYNAKPQGERFIFWGPIPATVITRHHPFLQFGQTGYIAEKSFNEASQEIKFHAHGDEENPHFLHMTEVWPRFFAHDHELRNRVLEYLDSLK